MTTIRWTAHLAPLGAPTSDGRWLDPAGTWQLGPNAPLLAPIAPDEVTPTPVGAVTALTTVHGELRGFGTVTDKAIADQMQAKALRPAITLSPQDTGEPGPDGTVRFPHGTVTSVQLTDDPAFTGAYFTVVDVTDMETFDPTDLPADEAALYELVQTVVHLDRARQFLTGLFTDDPDDPVPAGERPTPDRIAELLAETRHAIEGLYLTAGRLRTLMQVGPDPNEELYHDAGGDPTTAGILARRNLTQAELSLSEAREAIVTAHDHAAHIHGK